MFVLKKADFLQNLCNFLCLSIRKSTRGGNMLSFCKQLVYLFIFLFIYFYLLLVFLLAFVACMWILFLFGCVINVRLVLVNNQIAERRMLFCIVLMLFFLLFFRVVRLSTVVYLALKLTWALVLWFVTFWTIYLNMTSELEENSV